MVLASRSPPFFTPPSLENRWLFLSLVCGHRRIVGTPLSVPSMKQGARRLTRFQGGECVRTATVCQFVHTFSAWVSIVAIREQRRRRDRIQKCSYERNTDITM